MQTLVTRYSVTTASQNISSIRYLYSFEYDDIQAGTGYPHTEYAVFTTDKTLLVRAEAYALQGNYAAAVADLNTEVAAMSGGTMSVYVSRH